MSALPQRRLLAHLVAVLLGVVFALPTFCPRNAHACASRLAAVLDAEPGPVGQGGDSRGSPTSELSEREEGEGEDSRLAESTSFAPAQRVAVADATRVAAAQAEPCPRRSRHVALARERGPPNV